MVALSTGPKLGAGAGAEKKMEKHGDVQFRLLAAPRVAEATLVPLMVQFLLSALSVSQG
jgi:hypothetical protein